MLALTKQAPKKRLPEVALPGGAIRISGTAEKLGLLPDGGRVRLEVVQIGGTPTTSREALARFFHRLTEARLAPMEESAEAAERSEATRRRLEGAGLL